MTAFPFFGNRAKGCEFAFWDWFEKHEDELFHFERDQNGTFARLSNALKKVHPYLTFEFGPELEGVRHFVISADGMKEAFPSVMMLYSCAPALARWRFFKFRPRRCPAPLLKDDFWIEPEDLEVTLQPASQKVDLVVHMRRYDPGRARDFLCLAFLLLDRAVGEYDTEIGVGNVEVRHIDEPTTRSRYSLLALPEALDEMLSAPSRN